MAAIMLSEKRKARAGKSEYGKLSGFEAGAMTAVSIYWGAVRIELQAQGYDCL